MNNTMANVTSDAPPGGLPKECWVVTSRAPPFTIKAASDSWHALWGFSKEETIGAPISILNGEGSNASAGRNLMARLQMDGFSATARCTNTDKSGRLHTHNLLLLTHKAGLLGISTEIETNDAPSSRETHEANALLVPGVPGDDTMRSILSSSALQVQSAESEHVKAFAAEKAPDPTPVSAPVIAADPLARQTNISAAAEAFLQQGEASEAEWMRLAQATPQPEREMPE